MLEGKGKNNKRKPTTKKKTTLKSANTMMGAII
jgi:hypothetical protein